MRVKLGFENAQSQDEIIALIEEELLDSKLQECPLSAITDSIGCL